MPKIYIIIYSLYGHILTLAHSVKKGLESQGVEVKLFQVSETLPDSVLAKMHAPPKADIPVISVDKLSEADGFIFGIPTRFGTMPEQFKTFFDATGQLWSTGALTGKFAGIFTSTASQHGGQETTIMTTITYLVHQGMLYVPLGYANSNLFDVNIVNGGSPYGAGTITGGDGSRLPSEEELSVARTQGENFAKLVNAFHKGKTILEATKTETETETETKPKPTTAARAIIEEGEIPQRKGIWRLLCCV
ncbi:flavo protein-like protein [Endogone sp. FLAS-F59071]|nr:flavo protein-like protein [Endogone sp. FLAS-F59071]|eukprot:RUS20560.1 flavo protein-like protein [Endogone sp. FLAS-F59071]